MKMIFHITIAVLLLVFVVTVQIPIEIYLNNAHEFLIPLKELAYKLIPAFGIGCLVFFLPAVVPNRTFREGYFAILAMLALLMWFTAHFMFGSYGAFDARGLSIDKFSIRAVIEVIVWVTAFSGVFIFRKKVHRILLQAVSGVLIMVVALTGYQITHYTLYKNKNVNTEQNHDPHMTEEFLTFSKRGNIIHIVLDEQQSTVVEMLMASDPAFNQHLKGFTYFPNTVANYRSTVMAVPAMLTGQVYKNDSDKRTFLPQVLSHNAFTMALENAHYKTYIYSWGMYCNKAKIKNCIPHAEISSDLNAMVLLDYSMFKVLPDMIKPAIYNNDRWFLQRNFNSNYTSSKSGLSHLAFKYFNEHLIVKDTAPTYKFFHSMITHSPTIFYADCGLRPMRTNHNHLSERAEQSTCAFKHVFTLLDKLKQAGIYDNTMIIISSDHGASVLTEAQQKNLKHQNTVKSSYYPRALATLLIKPFHATEPLRVSNAPVSLNDIPNTILASVHLPLLPYGENALALTETRKRNREFIYFHEINWDENSPIFSELTIYNINGDVRDVLSWQMKCSDIKEDNKNHCTMD